MYIGKCKKTSGQVIKSICPESKWRISSPPVGWSANNKMANEAARTKLTPMIASCWDLILFSIILKKNAAIMANINATICDSHTRLWLRYKFDTKSPKPAIWATAKSINIIPLLSTSIPKGACVIVIIRPANKAGPIILKISLLII